jgi:hypothetical protein
VPLINHIGESKISADYSYKSSGFNTVVGDVKLGKGKFYYEIELLK